MESKDLSLTHLIQYPASHTDDSDAKYATIVALHGRGSNERDLIELAAYLPNDLLWISPRGSFPLGTDGYEWFQLMQVGKPEPTRLANAIDTLDRFLDEVMDAYPVDRENLYLLGFSQGTVVSLSHAVTRSQHVAGVLAHSGYLPHESGLQFDEVIAKEKKFLLLHGTQDSLLPVQWARRTYDTLQRLGTGVEYHEFPMGHQISAESLHSISEWLTKHIRR